MSTTLPPHPWTARAAAGLRAVPPTVWAMAGTCSIASYVLLAPWPTSLWSTQSPALDALANALANRLHPLLVLACCLAPMVALLRPRLALVLGLAGLVPTSDMSVHSSSFAANAFQLSGYLSLVCVAGLATWRLRRPALVPALFAMVVPTALCFSHGSIELVFAGNQISSAPWGDGEVVGAWLMYAGVGAGLALTFWSIIRAAQDALERRQRLDAELQAVAEHRLAVRNEAAAVDERARLARDLHDIVAHRISLIAVRAETAPYSQPGMDAASRATLEGIAGDARTALDEMREVLGVLHRSQDAGPRLPQPSTQGLTDLIAEVRNAGTSVEVHGTLPPLPDTTGTVAYRVVQEALTNARRHGAGPVEVDFGFGAEWASITVRNATSSPDRGEGSLTRFPGHRV